MVLQRYDTMIIDAIFFCALDFDRTNTSVNPPTTIATLEHHRSPLAHQKPKQTLAETEMEQTPKAI